MSRTFHSYGNSLLRQLTKLPAISGELVVVTCPSRPSNIPHALTIDNVSFGDYSVTFTMCVSTSI